MLRGKRSASNVEHSVGARAQTSYMQVVGTEGRVPVLVQRGCLHKCPCGPAIEFGVRLFDVF